MFESILFKNSTTPGQLLDAGRIAEALLFYGKVRVLGNTATVKELLKIVPPFIALRLMQEGRLELHYLGGQQAVRSKSLWPGVEEYGLIAFRSPQHTIEVVAPRAFRVASGNTGSSRIAANKFGDLVLPFEHDSADMQPFFQRLLDPAGTDAAVAAIVAILAPGYLQADPVRFHIEGTGEAFRIHTNLVLDRLNSEAHLARSVAADSKLNPAMLLALLLGVHEVVTSAATLASEVATNHLGQVLSSLQLGRPVAALENSERQLARFTDFVLEDSHAIRDAVNRGRVSIAEVVKVADKADRFRDWLFRQPASSDVVREFHRKTVEGTWIEKLPAKSTRFTIFTTAGLALDSVALGGAGTIAGIALNAADQFLFDKLLRGWKPHHFVEEYLRPTFVRSESPTKKKWRRR